MAELNFLVGFFLKPWVLIINGIILLRLFKHRSVSCVRKFLFAFSLLLAGELICALDVYFVKHMSLFNEGLHDVLMMISFGILFAGLHDYILRRKQCLNLSCDQMGSCLLEPAACNKSGRYGSFFGWLILGTASLAVIPMMAPEEVLTVELPAGLGDRVFGVYTYDRSLSLSVLQQLIMPMLAVILLFYSGIGYLVRQQLTPSLVWTLSLGIGALLFAYFRLVLVHFFHPAAALTSFGEEFLELVFVLLFLVWIWDKKWDRMPRAHSELQ